MNEDKYLPYASLLMRLALAITILSAVADRFGFWGEPGDKNVAWGDWFNFINYMHSLLPFTSRGVADKLAVATTVFEITFALMLLFGVKVRWAAVGTGTLFIVLAIAMVNAFGLKAPLHYSLFVDIAASFLLACIPIYKWTLHGIKKKKIYSPY